MKRSKSARARRVEQLVHDRLHGEPTNVDPESELVVLADRSDEVWTLPLALAAAFLVDGHVSDAPDLLARVHRSRPMHHALVVCLFSTTDGAYELEFGFVLMRPLVPWVGAA